MWWLRLWRRRLEKTRRGDISLGSSFEFRENRLKQSMLNKSRKIVIIPDQAVDDRGHK